MTTTCPTPVPVLDDLMPDHDFSERHHRRIAAPAHDVWQSLTTVTLADLTITRPLVMVRNLGRRPDTHAPLLTHGPLQLLDMVDGRQAIGGAVARPWRPRAEHRRSARSRNCSTSISRGGART